MAYWYSGTLAYCLVGLTWFMHNSASGARKLAENGVKAMKSGTIDL